MQKYNHPIVCSRDISDQYFHQPRYATKVSHQDFIWSRLARPGRVDANLLRQAKVVLVLPTQLDKAKTPLPVSLNRSANPFTIIIIIIIIIIIVAMSIITIIIKSFFTVGTNNSLG